MDVFEIEKKFPALQNIKINEIKAWPLLRILIGFEISRKNFNSKEVFDNKLSGKLSRITKSFAGWWNGIKKLKKSKYIIFTNLNEKRTYNDKFFDRLFHSTINEIGEENVLIVDFCEGKAENIDRSFYKNIINGDIFNYLGIIFSRFTSLHISEADKKLIEEVIKASGVHVDYESYFKQFFVKVRLYKKLYKLIQPKCVFTGCYTYYAQVYAAKQLNIKTIEFQHGLINSNHLGYRTLFPYKKDFTPDHLFSFGTDIFTNLDESVYKKEEIKPVGFCYFEMLENGFYQNINIEKAEFDKVICVPIDSIVENEIISFIVNIASSLHKILFIITPRATITENTLNKISDHPNIKYIFSPFQVVVQQCDFHLSIASTCAFESLYFGIPNLLYNSNGIARRTMGNILNEEQFSFYFDNEHELVVFLKLNKFFNKEMVSNAGKHFYLNEHTNNIRKAFKEII